MKKIVIIIVVIAALAAVGKSGLFSGVGSTTERTTADTLANVIKGGNSVRSQVLRGSPKIFKDYRVYKSEDGKGAIFEYTMMTTPDPEKMNLSTDAAKSQLLATLRKNKYWPQTKAVLKKGIYFHYQYKGPDGDTVLEFKVTENDI